jgi:hypothetical protein
MSIVSTAAGAAGMSNPIGAGLAIGGALIKGLAGASAARKKNALITHGIRDQSRAGMEATNKYGDFLSQLRGSAPAVAGARAALAPALSNAPAVSGLLTASPRFAADAARTTGTVRGTAAGTADNLATIRATQLGRQQEQNWLADLNQKLKALQLKAAGQQGLTGLRAGNVQANPWASLLGQVAQQGGEYMIGGSGG